MFFNWNFLKKFVIFTEKHLCWSLFLIKLHAFILATLLKTDSNTGVFLWILQTLITSISKNICVRLVLIVVIYCIENWIKLFRKRIGLLFLLKHKVTLLYLLSFVFIRFITRCDSLSHIAIFCYLLSFTVIRCDLLYHSLSLVVSLVVIRFTTRCHSLSLVIIRYTTCCHSLSLIVILCHSMYHSSVFL